MSEKPLCSFRGFFDGTDYCLFSADDDRHARLCSMRVANGCVRADYIRNLGKFADEDADCEFEN